MEEELTSIWRALLDPHRRAILDLLKERPRTTGELCAAFTVSRFAVMKHLTVLEEAGLVIVKREGRERWNYLNAVPLQQMYERWLKPYEAHVAASLLHMKQLVETDEERENRMSEQSASAVSLFHTELEVPIKASPERIYQALTRDIANWWDPDASLGPWEISAGARSGQADVGGFRQWPGGALWHRHLCRAQQKARN